jgi:hypothetical protein
MVSLKSGTVCCPKRLLKSGTVCCPERLLKSGTVCCPERLFVVTILRCVMFQKSADLIYTAAEV